MSLVKTHSSTSSVDKSSNEELFYAFFNKTNNDKKTVYSIMTMRVGYANRMYNVLSVLAVGLITNRVCLLRFPEYKNFIDMPIVVESANVTKTNMLMAKNIGPGQHWMREKNLTALMHTTIDNSTILRYSGNGALFFEICSNPIYYQKLLDSGAVSNATIRNALNLNNRTIEDKLEQVLQVGFEVAGFLMKTIWRLKPDFTATVNKYRTEFFGNNSFVIGMHIRSAYVNLSDIDKFAKCALELESNDKTLAKKHVKWFVVTDAEFYVNMIKAKHWNRTVLQTSGKAKHTGWNPGDDSGIKKALLDIELLSYCDEIIGTAGSTFSFLPSIKSQRLAFYVNGKRSGKQTNCDKMKLALPPDFKGSAVFK